MAKKFFYVCAGLFLLALTYQLGARIAAAQAPSNPVAAMSGTYPNQWVVTANGNVYYWSGSCWRQPDCRNVFGTPNASNPVVAMSGEYPNQWVVTANGDVYYWSGSCWTQPSCRNVFGTPTASTPTTWGQVKSTYRK